MRKLENTEKDLLAFFTDSYEHIRRRHYARTRKNKALIGYELARERTAIVDSLIERALSRYGYTELEGVSIVALGGYGREELSPYSDIDLLFLYGKDSKGLAEEIVERLLYLLWDTKMDIGNCTRSVEECRELSMDRNDTTILSSLLDSRFICGDRELYGRLENEIYGEVLPKISSDFIRRKVDERDRRGEKYGKTLYILEPNVKEGRGGLREFQTAMWIAQASYKARSFEEVLQRGFVSEKEYRVMRKCLNFLLLVRAQLHYQAKRREDSLSFEFQTQAAKSFGYRDGKLRAVGEIHENLLPPRRRGGAAVPQAYGKMHEDLLAKTPLQKGRSPGARFHHTGKASLRHEPQRLQRGFLQLPARVRVRRPPLGRVHRVHGIPDERAGRQGGRAGKERP